MTTVGANKAESDYYDDVEIPETTGQDETKTEAVAPRRVPGDHIGRLMLIENLETD